MSFLASSAVIAPSICRIDKHHVNESSINYSVESSYEYNFAIKIKYAIP